MAPQTYLDSLAAQREDAEHDRAFAAREAEQERAAFLSDPDYQRFLEEEERFGALADPARVRAALENGGHAVVTVRSHRTGAHVTISLNVRKRREGGEGWVPRNTIAGRVGMADGDVIEVRDYNAEYPNNYVGRLYLDTGEWRAPRDVPVSRAWAGERVIAYALTGAALPADVFLQSRCSYCSRPLEDPESIERGIGPECYGRHTSSRHARREA